MEVLRLNAGIPRSGSRVLNQMIKQSSGAKGILGNGAMGGTRQTASLTRVAPLNRNQAFGSSVPKAPTQRKSRKRKEGSPTFKRTVLVVDDVPDVTEMIGLFLKHAGYEVTTADSASAALRLASERAFDVIITDIGMPEMNGYELAESLRRCAEYQGTPIIAVTGYSEYDDRGRAQRSGFNAHLTKPIDPSELLLLMNELLSQ
jgi:CheY-like chemotaxis protein